MNSDETIDIRVVFKSLVEKKNTILFFLAISSVISIYASLALPNLYKSEALVEAVSSNSDSSGLGGLGGLASMAGVSISGPGGGSEAESAIAMTKSRDFFNSLINDYDFILPALMATESFNPETKKIEFDEKKYNQKKKEWNSYSSWVSSFKKPTNDQAYRYFIGKVFKVSRNNKTGYLLMTVEHKSPLFSHDLLKVIIKEVNQKSRQKDLKDSSKSLKFLKEEASRNKVNIINKSISELIQTQLQTQMMAKVHEDYLLKIIDSPYIPEKKSKPQRALICIAGLIIGFFLSLIYILITTFLIREK